MQVQVQIVPVRVQYALNNVQYDSAGAYCTRRGAYCTRTGTSCTRTGALNKHRQSPPGEEHLESLKICTWLDRCNIFFSYQSSVRVTKRLVFPTFEFLLSFFLNVVENSENAFPRSYGAIAPAFETEKIPFLFAFFLAIVGWGPTPADAYGMYLSECRLHPYGCNMNPYGCNMHLQSLFETY